MPDWFRMFKAPIPMPPTTRASTMMAIKFLQRVACTMLMILIIVVDCGYLIILGLNDNKYRRRTEMAKYLTLHALLNLDRKTYFHCLILRSEFFWKRHAIL